MLNKLLLRQIQKHFGRTEDVPANLLPLLKVISDSYDHYEKDRNMLERSVELSSNEMIELHNKLNEEAVEVKKIHHNLKTLFENIQEVFFSVEVGFEKGKANFKLLQISRACAKVYGCSSEEFFLSPDLWRDVILEEDKIIIDKHFPLLAKGQPIEHEYRIRHKDGSVRWISTKITPTLNESGKLIRLDGLTNDITSKKLSAIERDKITSDLIRQNKDLEQFAYIVSHNLRAPLANILGLSHIIQSENLDDHSRKISLTGLSSSVQKLDNVIMDLGHILQIKREINENKEIVQFSRLVDDIKLSVSNFIEEEDVHIYTDFSEINEIFTLKSYLHSIFYNLISNSIKYRDANRKPAIEIVSRQTDNSIILVFKDNGIGIDLKTNGDKIFGLYKRFHLNVEGKGMGLFMVKTQIETLSGKVTVNSELNKGSEFILEFEKQVPGILVSSSTKNSGKQNNPSSVERP